MKHKLTVMTALVGVLVCFAGSAGAGDLFEDTGDAVIENIGSAQVNWQTMRLRVAGEAAAKLEDDKGNKLPPGVVRLSAVRAAKQIAFVNALEALQGVKISSDTTVKQYLDREAELGNETIRSKVEGIIRGSEVEERRKYYADLTAKVVIEVPLTKDMASLLLQKEQFAEAPPVEPPAAAEAEPYTGLVIDARGLDLEPALSPKVFDEQGGLIYGAAVVSKKLATDQGIVAYSKEWDKDRSNDRVKDKPLVVKALKVKDGQPSDLVLAQADAEQVRAAPGVSGILSNARVVILLSDE